MNNNELLMLENIAIEIRPNNDKLTLKELVELYGKDYIPPYFMQNYGKIYPCSEFFKNKFIELDKSIGEKIKAIKEKSKNVPDDCSRSWKNKQKRYDKILTKQII
ncbi:MAG: hypothetical protein LUH05_04165 [Candidatus Gastranaerophilales bacterium]|nr:hypothetical protein [Candidatus Gastranaerophilales bacterium]